MSTKGQGVLSGATWLMVAYVVKLGLGFLSFIWLTRILGPDSFGAVAGLWAFVTLISPLVDLGAYHLIVDEVTDGVETRTAIGNSALLTAVALPIGFLLLIAAKLVVFDELALLLVLEAGVAQFVGDRAVTLAVGTHIAHGLIWKNAVIEISSAVSRLVSVSILWYLGGGMETWVHILAIGAVLFGMACIFWVIRVWGLPKVKVERLPQRLRKGWHYAIGHSARNANNDLDKTMLMEMHSYDVAGIYSAAYRFIAIAFFPLNAVLGAAHRFFFISGGKGEGGGIVGARRYAFKLLPLTIAYGVIMTLSLWVLAPYFVMMLGPGYGEVEEALRWLSILPLIISLSAPFADALTGSRLQSVRSKATLITLIINLVLNSVLIPILGWKGAVISTVFTQLIFLVYVFIVSGDRALKGDYG